MIDNGDYETNKEHYINITPNTQTLKSIIIITNSKCKINFTGPNTIAPIFGFDNIILDKKYNESKNVVNIISINSIFVNVDIINGSYVNGATAPTIYSFFPKVPPGYKSN